MPTRTQVENARQRWRESGDYDRLAEILASARIGPAVLFSLALGERELDPEPLKVGDRVRNIFLGEGAAEGYVVAAWTCSDPSVDDLAWVAWGGAGNPPHTERRDNLRVVRPKAGS